MRLRKALPVAVVLPSLLAASACSGESSDPDEKKPKASAGSTPGAVGADAKAAAEAERMGAMAPQALEKATLSGKENGFEAKKVAEAEVEAGRDMKADKAECQPLASLAGGFTHIPAVSVEHRALEPTEAKNATIGSMWLASHSETNAAKVLAELRTSLKECPGGFKTLGLTYKAVQPVKAPALGDESVGYRITNVVGKRHVTMTYTVVREDGVVAVFYGVNMLTPQKSAIPEAVVKAQLERLG
ncbi:hypothetical protein AWI43_10600 [Streptomyces sp. WAC04657]|uniref:hypothetical protein n=1 Tax=unclassified Streptomyces TaxID=2593676 RepID=UPI0007878CFF|nr:MULTISPECIES: hypothetical protein [unclassified Streptomyces]KYG54853.1 hypothetical protein AWI43_10600 [Streptomyces sp. WAC04657]